MKIGILGGTFNPVHNGHISIAEQVKEKLSLDKIIFVPSFIPPHKQNENIASADDRINMVKLALANSENLEVSAIEVDREGVSYTIDTLKQIKAFYNEEDEIFFIIGSDNVKEFETWRKPEEIVKVANIVVVQRPGSEDLNIEFNGFIFVDTDPCSISAKNLRNKMKKGLSIAGELPDKVLQYITKKSLYVNE